MTITDQIKIVDKKIMQNEAQYDLDRKAAIISALSSNSLDKYKCLTGEDLRLKPSTIKQARLEYSPLDCLKGLKILKISLKMKIKKNQNQLKTKNSQKNLKMNQPWLIKSQKK